MNKEATYQRLIHKDCDLKMFKPFGCTSLIYIPFQNWTKLDVTSDRETLFDLSEGNLCYKIYCHCTKSIMQARDVTFIGKADDLVYID